MSVAPEQTELLKLSFVRGKDFTSKLIGWFGAGLYSHVDCEFPDGTLWGARSDAMTIRGIHIPAGVQPRPANYEVWPHRTVLGLPCTPYELDRYLTFIERQRGKPYDWQAIVSFAIERDWRMRNAWICSEVQAAAGESSGVWGIKQQDGSCELALPVNKITPGMLAMMVSGRRSARVLLSY